MLVVKLWQASLLCSSDGHVIHSGLTTHTELCGPGRPVRVSQSPWHSGWYRSGMCPKQRQLESS